MKIVYLNVIAYILCNIRDTYASSPLNPAVTVTTGARAKTGRSVSGSTEEEQDDGAVAGGVGEWYKLLRQVEEELRFFFPIVEKSIQEWTYKGDSVESGCNWIFETDAFQELKENDYVLHFSHITYSLDNYSDISIVFNRDQKEFSGTAKNPSLHLRCSIFFRTGFMNLAMAVHMLETAFPKREYAAAMAMNTLEKAPDGTLVINLAPLINSSGHRSGKMKTVCVFDHAAAMIHLLTVTETGLDNKTWSVQSYTKILTVAHHHRVAYTVNFEESQVAVTQLACGRHCELSETLNSFAVHLNNYLFFYGPTTFFKRPRKKGIKPPTKINPVSIADTKLQGMENIIKKKYQFISNMERIIFNKEDIRLKPPFMYRGFTLSQRDKNGRMNGFHIIGCQNGLGVAPFIIAAAADIPSVLVKSGFHQDASFPCSLVQTETEDSLECLIVKTKFIIPAGVPRSILDPPRR